MDKPSELDFYQDIMDVAEALDNWLESQDIDDKRAIPTMMVVAASHIMFLTATITDKEMRLKKIDECVEHAKVMFDNTINRFKEIDKELDEEND